MKVIAGPGQVYVETIPEPTTTESGMLLPDSAKIKPCRGKVLSVQPGEWLQEGDQVLYQPYAGTEYEVNGKEMLLMSIKDILAKEVAE